MRGSPNRRLAAGRQQVTQEAQDELVGLQVALALAACFVVARSVVHLALVAAEQAVVRERQPMGIAGDVVEHSSNRSGLQW